MYLSAYKNVYPGAYYCYKFYIFPSTLNSFTILYRISHNARADKKAKIF
jgi:hypothetical protein